MIQKTEAKLGSCMGKITVPKGSNNREEINQWRKIYELSCKIHIIGPYS